MSDAQIVETPAVETPAIEASVTEQPKESFDQTMERVGREIIEGKRGPDGKFQSRVVAPGAPETPELPGKPEAAPPELAPPAIEAPQSLPDDVKKAWPTLPRAIQEIWSKREGEAHEKITADGQRLKALTAFEEVLKPLDERLKQVGAPAHEYVRRLAAADQLLATNGPEGIRQIAQMYGIDLRAALQIGNQPGSQPNPQQPDINALVQQKVDERLRDQRIAERQTEIEKFKAALPADEQADFEALDNVMVGLAAANPKLTLDQLYKAARRADDGIAAKDKAKADAAALKAAEEEAKKKAAQDARLAPLGKKPGSTPTGPIKGKTWQDTLDTVGKEILARE